jgi:hypothetical protein
LGGDRPHDAPGPGQRIGAGATSRRHAPGQARRRAHRPLSRPESLRTGPIQLLHPGVVFREPYEVPRRGRMLRAEPQPAAAACNHRKQGGRGAARPDGYGAECRDASVLPPGLSPLSPGPTSCSAGRRSESGDGHAGGPVPAWRCGGCIPPSEGRPTFAEGRFRKTRVLCFDRNPSG